jgi:hypothetical protein
MDEHPTSEVQDLDAVVAADQSARVQAQSAIIQLSQEARVSGVA